MAPATPATECDVLQALLPYAAMICHGIHDLLYGDCQGRDGLPDAVAGRASRRFAGVKLGES